MKLSTLEDELKRLRELSSNDTKQTTAKNVQNDLKPQVKNGLLINSISKTYDNRKVVNEVSMNLKRGEAVGLLGPNGAGKTTTMRILTGFLKPDKGSVKIKEKYL